MWSEVAAIPHLENFLPLVNHFGNCIGNEIVSTVRFGILKEFTR